MEKEQQFRPINFQFLNEEITETFDIFYKTEAFGSTKFVKFASANPQHQDKVRRLIEEKEGEEEFFIQSDDLMKYYNQATAHLKGMMADPSISTMEKTKKIYNVS